MKKIIITGGAGFIGSHVIRRFVNRYPQYLIINVDALTYAGNLENLIDIEHQPNYVFERADIKCSFGEVKVYFDNALIPSGKADIYLDVSFGEAVLYIPKNWKIINNVQVFLGDMEHRSGDIDVNSPEVTIHGNISFGDTKVIFV